MKILYLLRAVSGSGKTTLASQLEKMPNTVAISSDDYFYELGEGDYAFDIDLLEDAHNFTFRKVSRKLSEGEVNVVLHNTNTEESDIEPYIELAKMYGYRLISLIVENRAGTVDVHGVPEEVLQRQERTLRESIKLR